MTELISINIEEELKQSYLDYAMSVIVGRALPDVRDGLKPVHRRILYAMHELNNDWNKPYKKSARVVGDVIGKYHPHGDSAIYDAIVRMAQDFSMRCMLIDGQGNFGSIDGDSPAAMRYTEIRMSKISHELLADLEKQTVNFVPNYDDTELMPEVLPTKVPNLLINGSSGIAVGMATNIPPHNLKEVIDGCLQLITNPEVTLEELIKLIPGPDFPTAGIINGRAGIVEAYKNGKGKIYVRGRLKVEDGTHGKQSIIIYELPYQVNKARLIEKIAELVKDKRLEGISTLRDESDKEGMRIVIELKKGECADVVINNLYSLTQLQTVFGINMVALANNQPRVLNLKMILDCFVQHRREVVLRRTEHDLKTSKAKAHVLEGLAVAISNIDAVIKLIKNSKNPAEAKAALLDNLWLAGPISKVLAATEFDLCKPVDLERDYGLQVDAGENSGKYKLSMLQAQAILDLKLHRLTGLEQDKILSDYQALIEKIKYYLSILRSNEKLMQVIEQELRDVQQQFADPRRTEIISLQQDLSIEDLITEENVVVTLSKSGYVKSQQVKLYQAQRRGGKGKMAATVKDEDVIFKLLVASTHDTLLCFSNLGKVYWLKVHQIPIAGRASKGRPIVNLLNLSEQEQISAILPIKDFATEQYIFMATGNGTVKKVPLAMFQRPRNSGIISIDLADGDQLIGVELVTGHEDIILSSDAGKAVRFKGEQIRSMGRSAKGVRGIKLQSDQRLISLIVVKEGGTILTATENGFGKRTNVDEFPIVARGGQGVKAIQINSRNGKVIGALQAYDQDELMLITDQGTLTRIRVNEISVISRNTKGVKLINLSPEENLVEIERILDEDANDNDAGSNGNDQNLEDNSNNVS
jgi:DNA gyrase subunit A